MITRYSLREQMPAGRRLKILLAEDNLVNQKLASRLLEKRNHVVTIVSNGKEALLALEKNQFDLVLMDVQMPEMDGLEATRILRESEFATGQHQPVVAMTALAMNGDKERCISAGMDGYLSKPIRPQELDQVLDSYMAIKEEKSPSIDQPSTAESPVDADQLLDRIDGDRTLLAELVDLFRVDCPGNLRMAQEAIDRQDAGSLMRSAHTLKGALSNLSATRASALAADLEAIGISLDLTHAQATLDSLVREAGEATRALEALCFVNVQ